MQQALARSIRLWLPLISLAAALPWLTFPIDDAYITFRYAEQLLSGQGLVYNSGVPVLGVTTPLWALLLSAAAWAGGGYEAAALSLNAVALVWAGLLVQQHLLRPLVGNLPAFLIVPLLFLFFQSQAALFSGMEALPYALCVIGGLIAAQEKRFWSAGFWGAAATLLRPDGVLLVAVAGAAAFFTNWRACGKVVLAPILLVVPAALAATWYYGSPIPHSVAAKQVIHYSSWTSNAGLIVQALFALRLSDFLAATLGLMGLLRWQRERGGWPICFWCALYLVGLCFSGVKPIFFWYFSPLWIVFLTFGLTGLLQIVKEKRPAAVTKVWTAAVLVLVATSFLRPGQVDPCAQREALYRQAARDLQGRVQPGESLYFCETGILGFAFKDNFVLDAAGINSPEIFDHRRRIWNQMRQRGQAEVSMSRVSRWSIEIVKDLRPDWIISPRFLCQLALMEEDEAWFKETYERLAVYPLAELGGVGVYRKIKRSTHSG